MVIIKRTETAEERKTRIFRERAVKLAAGRPDQDQGGEWLDIVEFLLGGERYAVESVFVGEVFPPGEITPIPCTPSFLSGVVNLRGKIVPVVDPGVLFGIAAAAPAGRPRILLLSDGSREMGLLTDGIGGIGRVRREDLHPPLPTMTGRAASCLAGISGGDIAVLDCEKLLGDSSLSVDEEP